MKKPNKSKKRVVTVKQGRFKGKSFEIDKTIKVDDCLPLLASQGNYAAKNAIEIDGYTIENAPFIYGKIDSFGYIISAKDLGIPLTPTK